MAMGAHLTKKSISSQFEAHHESMRHKEWEKQQSYPDYKKHKVPFPDPNVVEFGKVFDIPVQTIDDENLVQVSYQTVLADYFREKAENFPTWHGLPTIKVQEPSDSLRRIWRIGWHVAVPKQCVVDQDQKKEDELWNS